LHHARFNVNYAFPFDFIDRACGTYAEIKRDARAG
jgi:sterol desaturase/sphingolipid hydroxylase (fatty acid hydroxylase superfamily)